MVSVFDRLGEEVGGYQAGWENFMSDESDIHPGKKIADRFRAMADRIEKTVTPSDFGGAVVIIPPSDGGDPVEILQIDPKPSPSEFWGLIRYKSDAAVAELNNQSRMQSAFRR